MIDNFDRIEALDRDQARVRVEKPDDSAYVLRYNEQELVQISENIAKMAFVEADFGLTPDEASSVEQTLRESDQLIESMMSHKEAELKKIKELVEKFRQLRRDQELQLGNTIREIKVIAVQDRSLDFEMKFTLYSCFTHASIGDFWRPRAGAAAAGAGDADPEAAVRMREEGGGGELVYVLLLPARVKK